MWAALKATNGWLWTAAGVLGVIFGFLFFGSKAETQIGVVWVYPLVWFLMCLLAWALSALDYAVKQQRQTVARIIGVFSATDDPGKDLSFLLDPNESFGSMQKCSVFYLEMGVELYLGGGFVYNVQEDKKVQLKISSREASKAAVWGKIEANDKTYLDKILVKVGERVP